MTPRPMHRLAPVLGAVLAAIIGVSILAGGAAARAHHPRCGYHVRVIRGYTVRMHKHRTSGVFAVYLLAPERFVAPHGLLCIDVIARRRLPLVRPGSGRLGSWMEIVHNDRSIFPGFGGRPVFANTGVVITLPIPGTLAAIERCPGCFTLQLWPLGYRGRRPELSAGL